MGFQEDNINDTCYSTKVDGSDIPVPMGAWQYVIEIELLLLI